MKLRKSTLVALIAGSGLAVGAIAGIATGTAIANDKKEYSVNDAGQTYGSATLAPEIGADPDLIQAVATNGEEGYVLSEDLVGPVPASPEEAAKLSSVPAKDRAIHVYLNDGKTVIGEFIVQGAQPN